MDLFYIMFYNEYNKNRVYWETDFFLKLRSIGGTIDIDYYFFRVINFIESLIIFYYDDKLDKL